MFQLTSEPAMERKFERFWVKKKALIYGMAAVG